jgi:arylsulfatase A-like enzyme
MVLLLCPHGWRVDNAYTRYHGRVWNASVPLSSYYVQDTCTWETKFPLGNTYFPHVMPQRNTDKEKKEYDRAFSVSTFVVDHQFDFACAVLNQYQMGRDNSTDILNLSISTTDYVGHAHGADSRETFELYIHVDRELGKFLSFVDRIVGAENYVVVVASDHGVAPVPERAIANGEEAGRLVELDVVTSIERYLQDRIPNASAKYVRSFVKPNFFLNEEAFASKSEYRRWTDSVAMMVRRIEGIGAVATFDQLQSNIKPSDVALQTFILMQKDFFSRRNGDLLIYPKYGWIFGSITATHGVYHTYDRHIPLVVSGFGIKQAVSTLKVSAACIAPTLAELLGITMPSTEGFSLFKKIF